MIKIITNNLNFLGVNISENQLTNILSSNKILQRVKNRRIQHDLLEYFVLINKDEQELLKLVRLSLQTLIKNIEFDTFDEVKTLNLYKQYKSLHFVLISTMFSELQHKDINIPDWVSLKVR